MVQLLHMEGSQSQRSAADEARMLAAIAHDLKTPLVFISAAASQLQLLEIDAASSRTQLVRIEQSAKRLLSLIDGMVGVAHSHQAQLPLEPLVAAEIIDQAVADITPYAHELGFSIQVDVSHRLPPVLSHSISLRRVLFNLLDNAVKYSRQEKRILVRARRDGSRVRISVRDHGIGLHKKDIETIFKLFGKVSEPSNVMAGSSGLGLFIAHNLSEMLAAELRVRPLSVGSNFYIRLPVAQQMSLFA